MQAIRARGADGTVPLIVSESGISSAGDVRRLAQSGAQAYLIGEALIASGDPGENLRSLIAELNGV